MYALKMKTLCLHTLKFKQNRILKHHKQITNKNSKDK